MNSTVENPSFPIDSPYRRLAACLDALPNRFPPADDESDLRLLQKLFEPQEAELAALLLPEIETPADFARRIQRDMRETSLLLKEMAKKGLITVGKNDRGRLGFSLMPFVVGIYEAQIGRIDAEMAQLFEAYYQNTFHKALENKPQVHRVIPVGESIDNNMEIHPFESAADILDSAQSWGVMDCICRTQKKLIGDPCSHPVDVCMVLSSNPNEFKPDGTIRPLTLDEAKNTLKRAASAGLVHCVSNNQADLTYVCNCCTCSCAVLRGMAEMGIANVVAASAFVNQADEKLCSGCGTCLDACQFGALTLEDTIQVQTNRCVGCGVCVPLCPQDALQLVRRDDASTPPLDEEAWRKARISQYA